ncbi:uncharacterized protein LOC108671220 isoform X3 [Hyalella azteca]|uniref:Uncharacterized protein LOC108671220 isoform X3 n=1 Tax=Hyalella azteca TaxID=294128 RepID=A0A8B7NKN1_HYAAZ|nr:uncharacterized protein LOC108671220 isoform X3 [Hyalella azteca]
MGNFLYSCCPPSAYSLVRYQAVTVRPRRGSEDERLELEIRTQPNGWQSAGARIENFFRRTKQKLCQSFTGLHTGAVQEHHLASLIVNPLADTEPFTYSSPPREPVTLAHDLLEVQSQRTTSIELEWDQEPDMSQYKSTKALHTTSHTVDSSMGGLSSSRLRSLCSTPASLEWDFKESTTSLQAAPLVTQEDEDLWGASETEELLQEIELLASRALRDEDELEPELDDRSFDER